jgi:signal peptidase I
MDISVIVSSSMQPTLAGTSADNSDRVITEKVTYCFRAPRRWEVITFTNSTGEKRMKRVVRLPGESVQMLVSNELLIDGRRVEPPPALDVRYIKYGNLMDGKTVPCGDGYYVLGDDLKDSDDSRFNDPVPASHILGRTWLIVWPYTRFGFVN